MASVVHAPRRLPDEVPDHRLGRGLPNVGGLGLEGQPPERDGPPPEVSLEVMEDPPGDEVLLALVHQLHGVKKRGLYVHPPGELLKGPNILGEAGPSETAPRVEECVPYPGVGADSEAHLLHICSGALAHRGNRS